MTIVHSRTGISATFENGTTAGIRMVSATFYFITEIRESTVTLHSTQVSTLHSVHCTHTHAHCHRVTVKAVPQRCVKEGHRAVRAITICSTVRKLPTWHCGAVPPGAKVAHAEH